MGEAALGTVTAHHYSLHASRPANKAFLDAWRKEFGANAPIPNYMAIAAWDGMDAIFYAIKKQGGKVDPDKSMAALKEWSNPNSPRGPVKLDPQTRDVVHNMYIREVKLVEGRPANIEFVTIPEVRDPGSDPGKQ
jgi:branched-chain amino acid transport system substrate-binding protein